MNYHCKNLQKMYIIYIIFNSCQQWGPTLIPRVLNKPHDLFHLLGSKWLPQLSELRFGLQLDQTPRETTIDYHYLYPAVEDLTGHVDSPRSLFIVRCLSVRCVGQFCKLSTCLISLRADKK